MPELPEVRAQAARLDDTFRGATLAGFAALSFSGLKTATPDPSVAFGAPVRRIASRGKYLLVELEPVTFAVHLMQGGRLEPDPRQSRRPRGGVARWTFEGGDALLLSEAGKEHRAGVWVVEGDPELPGNPCAGLGPEADRMTLDELAAELAANRGRLHGFLRDQRHLAGLGRRLANETCHSAGLSPFSQTSSLGRAQVERLHRSIGSVIAESLAYESTQEHMTRSSERPAAVHHRTGQPCPVCNDTVCEVAYRHYTVNYCPTCQTGGKVLADNTTSKFLK